MAGEKKKPEERRIDSSQIFYCEVCKKINRGDADKCEACGGALKEASDGG